MQKQLLTSVLFLLLMSAQVQLAWSQPRNAVRINDALVGVIKHVQQQETFSRSSHNCDTLANFSATDTITLYIDENGGYMAGHNSYMDKGKADFFENTNNKEQLAGVYMLFGIAEYSSPSSKFQVNAWDVSNDDKPGTILATEEVTIQSIAAAANSGTPVYIEFADPVDLSGDFFVGITYQYAAGDTVALMTTTDRGDGNLNTAWEQWDDNTWNDYPSSWESWLSHFIVPVVCASDGSSGMRSTDMGRSIALYPNPAKKAVTLELSLDVNAQDIMIFNVFGAKILQQSLNPGQQKLQTVDINQLEPGVYFLQLTDGFKTIGNSKLVVR